jgi:predicted DNA-binding protein (UPF0251 family)/predicted Fe-Mo cluster-binding NifX family protein
MARPRMKRRVGCFQEGNIFRPKNVHTDEMIELTIDAYETIRLIDLEGMTQLEASKVMGVSRTTVQALYKEARNTIAKAMFEHRMLQIIGGSYIMKEQCCCSKAHNEMKTLAIMVKNEEVTPVFHEADAFIVYTINGKEIERKDKIIPMDEHNKICRKYLLSLGVDQIVSGAMLSNTYNKYRSSQIEVYYAKGKVDQVLEQYLNDQLEKMEAHQIHDEHVDCHGKPHEANHKGCCGHES